MAYTRKNIKNLTGGVSQQPDSERYDNQCTAQTNFLSDPVRGLTKRAGTNFVQAVYKDGTPAALLHDPKNTFTHVINRSSGEQLMLVIGYDGDDTDGDGAPDVTPDISLLKLNEEDNTAEVLDLKDADGNALDGTELDYLDIANSHDTHPYSAVTIADYTFIANKDKTPALKATTSGGAGMYERDHVKRGLIYVKESAYNAEFSIKATDSEGTVRSIRIFTNSGTLATTSRRDVQADQVAGCLHWALEKTNEHSINSAGSIGSQAFYNGTGIGAGYTQHGEENLGLSASWSDDSDDFLWNGPGHPTDSDYGGSNYDSGHCIFTANPDHTDILRVIGDGGTSGINYHTFEFTSDGSVSAGRKAVTLGATADETAENLVATANAIEGVSFTTTLTWEDGAHPRVRFINNTEESMSGPGSGQILAYETDGVTNVDWDQVSWMSGANAVPDSSTAPVRYPITFERLPLAGKDGDADTAGCVISWFASYPSKEARDASPISFDVDDSFGGEMIQVFTEKTDRISVLPNTAPNNYIIKVEGDVENDADDHYIKFKHDSKVATNNQFGKGKWTEDMQSGLPYQIDETTMPHQLVKYDEGEYRIYPADWTDKVVGDANSDAVPSFIGNPINDIFFYKSRLGFLAGESVVMSEVDYAYNFWKTSVINLMDSDRIDVSSSVNEITYLNWAVPFANQLVIFSDRAQFLLTQGNQGLTPSTAALSLGSSYENSTIARPVVNDSTIIFAQEKSGASALYEMYATGNTELSFEAISISEHIPRYITGKIVRISASSLASTVVVQTDAGDNTLYIYRYFNSGEKRMQSAWSKYELACDYIKGGHFISDKFHIIEGHNKTSGTTVADAWHVLTYMKFDNTDSLTNAVDFYYNVTADEITDNSDLSLIDLDSNFPIRDNTPRAQKIVVFNKSTNEEYKAADTQESEKWKITVKSGELGDSTDVVVGLKYTASYEFSKQYIKRRSADGKKVAVTDGRTTNKWVEVYFNDTQHLTTTVSFPTESDFRSDSAKTFTGNPDDTLTGVRIGEQPSETESLRTSVAARNDLPSITLSSDTHQTVTITGAAFELMHTSRLSRTS